MELCLGGDLFTLLKNKKTFSDDNAKFYAACVVEALNYLYLKPENLVLDNQGYGKLIDFGCAKELKNGKVDGALYGTMEYMAPEIKSLKEHDTSVDY